MKRSVVVIGPLVALLSAGLAAQERKNPVQPAPAPAALRLGLATLLGGSGDLYGGNLLVDATGSVCFAVTTTSTDFPTSANAFARSFHGGASGRGGGDAVVVKLNPTGAALEYSSYVGGREVEYANYVAFDCDGSIWLSGDTASEDFPVAEDAAHPSRGGLDCFFAKLDPRGGALQDAYSLGGSKTDRNAAIAVDSTGRLVLTGRTESADFPTTADAKSRTLQGPTDRFVALYDPRSKSLRYSTLLGGIGNEVPGPLVLASDSVYLAGNTTSGDFPVTPGAVGTTYKGGTNEWGCDAFVARFALTAMDKSSATPQRPTSRALIQGLGDLPDGNFESMGLRVSADGSVVVGNGTTASGKQAFQWTQREGMVSLGNLSDGGFKHSWAVGVSADGSVIVGYGDPDGAGKWETHRGFRWTQRDGMVLLSGFDGTARSEALAVSADGSVIVGDGGKQTYRWTQCDGMVGLGVLPGRSNSRAIAVSADGSVIAGSSYQLPAWDHEEAFVWTEADGLQGLGLPPGCSASFPNAISADGSVIVGSLPGAGVFRWSRSTGMTRLGQFPGAKVTHPSAVTADGAIIVGTSFTDRRTPGTAFIWDAAHGMRSLQTVLETEHAANLTGWHLQNASGLTPDGSVIVGWGTNPSGQTEAFRVELKTTAKPPASRGTGLAHAMAALFR